MTAVDLRAHLEQYYDAAPRHAAYTEDFESLTLFLRSGPGFAYYARPTLGHHGSVSADDVRAVLARQRELDVPRALEWVAETTPSLAAAADAAGMTTTRHPLMVQSAGAAGSTVADASDDRAAGGDRAGGGEVTGAGVEVRILGAADPLLASALAVPHLAFGEPGTAPGTAGVDELDRRTAVVTLDGSVDRMAGRIRAGTGVLAAAIEDGRALCAGQHNPVGSTTEIVGVGTLPTARHRGLAAAVTAALLADARARGIQTVFLSAGDEDVARIYQRLGFEPVGTAMIAEAP